ncbi:MAG: hypothetical protein KDJ25_07085 [Rhodoblastus sp.]|nr:hypothetical protein [Rhodoblastus sp.]
MTMRRWRLASGLVMFVYISTHMLNHALGLRSLGHAEAALGIATALWRSLPGTILLYGAASVHFALALTTLYERRHWKLPAIEWVRLWAGFSLPWLLIGHVYSTRVADQWFAAAATYQNVVGTLARGGLQGWQIALLAPGWIHGCLGLWITLRRYPLMLALKPALVAIMIGLPILSAVGFGAMTRAAIAAPAPSKPDRAEKTEIEAWRRATVVVYFALIFGAAGAGLLRNAREKRKRA